MIIARVEGEDSFNIIGRIREVIRIGSLNNLITADEMSSAVKILKRFKTAADSRDAEIKAVATSAVREAENSSEFLKKIAEETGIKAEIISGQKEAELIYTGIQNGLKLKNKKLFCIDIGGGSSEFILGQDNYILYAESIKIGAVRLTNKFFHDYLLTKDSIQNCSIYVQENIMPVLENIRREGFDFAAGASGTIQSVAGFINYTKNKNQHSISRNTSFSSKDLKNISELIFSKNTAGDRKAVEGIEIKRADILPAGLIILNKIFDILNLKELLVSSYGLREGILLNMIRGFN
jgi:exopolyphosphatase/guanosine-5'-triphosphate,3'-diphosphate pyrophosphatase